MGSNIHILHVLLHLPPCRDNNNEFYCLLINYVLYLALLIYNSSSSTGGFINLQAIIIIAISDCIIMHNCKSCMSDSINIHDDVKYNYDDIECFGHCLRDE